MNTFLVTGGCGFIGSNLVDALIELGHKVVVIDNLSSDAHDKFYFNDKAKYYENNINDPHVCNFIFKEHFPTHIINLAAEARIQNCIENPTLCIKTNFNGTQSMLELALKYKSKRFVQMSTSAIYGLNTKVPQSETDTPDCLNPYSYSKLFAEQLCKMYSDMHGLDTVCFRGFNIYGPRQPKRGSYAPVIGIFSRQKKANETLSIVGDGEQKRDFIHVKDVCSALIAGALNEKKQNGAVYNLGTGTNFSIKQIAEMFNFPYSHVPQRAGEARETLANIEKIKNAFDWKPTIFLKEYMENQSYDMD